jgi:hypothetical protein
VVAVFHFDSFHFKFTGAASTLKLVTESFIMRKELVITYIFFVTVLAGEFEFRFGTVIFGVILVLFIVVRLFTVSACEIQFIDGFHNNSIYFYRLCVHLSTLRAIFVLNCPLINAGLTV